MCVLESGLWYHKKRCNSDDCGLVAVIGKKKAWSWDQYLREEKAIAVPLRLFTEVSITFINQ